MKAGVLAAARRVLHVTDPGRKLRRLADKAQSHGDTYERDIGPWIGRQLSVFVPGRAGTASSSTRARARWRT